MVFCNVNFYIHIYHLIIVTILILIDGFLQSVRFMDYFDVCEVTILILIDGFLQLKNQELINRLEAVTILILIDGFLQFVLENVIIAAIVKSQSLF